MYSTASMALRPSNVFPPTSGEPSTPRTFQAPIAPMRVTQEEVEDEAPSRRLIIAIDFGTTYSAVSYAQSRAGEHCRNLDLHCINSVHNFPDYSDHSSDDRMRSEVPTQVIYPVSGNFRQQLDLDAMEEGSNDDDDDSSGNDSGSGGRVDSDDRKTDDMMALDIENSETFQWGYGVHEAWSLPSTHNQDRNRPMARFKLLLDESPVTKAQREALEREIKGLQRKKIIKNSLHVIADYLTCLLRHTKNQLEWESISLEDNTEFVLCVPAIWTQKACRQMQTAMAIAMKRARFDGVDIQNNSIENLFIVSEPEAAAAYVLARESEVSAGDSFLLIDAGGGTVDANVYSVSSARPLRLATEVVAPGGGLHGSSFLNEAFAAYLHDLLREETYLERELETLHSIIERITHTEFELKIKRSFHYQESKSFKRISIPGLRNNLKKGFKDGMVHIRYEKIKEIFLAQLCPIGDIMVDQLKAARAKEALVQKVILVGGFANSRSLEHYIKQRLCEYCMANDCDIKLILPKEKATVVASGAVLRAFDKTRGPERIARSSYGVLRSEHFKDHPEEHAGLKPHWDRDDGLPYIKKTIDWVLKLGQKVPPIWTCEPFLCTHTFPVSRQYPLICKEVLYVSDSSTLSHYRVGHKHNEGAEVVGEIEVDFSFLRDQGDLTPVEPRINATNTRRIGRRHYKIEFMMHIRVTDRDLRCYARYGDRIMKRCRLNIAAAFKPGVK